MNPRRASAEDNQANACGSSSLAGDSSSCQDLSSSLVCQKNQNNGSPNEKEVEDVCSSSVFQAEFLRLSLGFKCDLFTLEKRVRLEERSRDLAEGSLRKEITGALKLLDESRVSKAVEVMIQHVENLKRTYAREHAELEELKELLLQNEKSFSSLGDRDDSSIKKLSGSIKLSSLRRVSTAPLPRSSNGNAVAFLQLVYESVILGLRS
ncbi:Lymphoid-restricted membrane protein, partial [Ophiophagus hannah]